MCVLVSKNIWMLLLFYNIKCHHFCLLNFVFIKLWFHKLNLGYKFSSHNWTSWYCNLSLFLDKTCFYFYCHLCLNKTFVKLQTCTLCTLSVSFPKFKNKNIFIKSFGVFCTKLAKKLFFKDGIKKILFLWQTLFSCN